MICFIIVIVNMMEDFEVLVDNLKYMIDMELVDLFCANIKKQPVDDFKVCLV